MIFKPMLAATVDSIDKLQYPVMVSPKLDGVRMMVQAGKAVSRNLKRIPNKFTQEYFGQPLFENLDGELVVGSPTDPDVFNTTSSGVMSKSGEPDVKFYVFDLYHDLLPFGDRYSKLANLVPNLIQSVVLVKHTFCDHPDDLREAEQNFLDDGYEGLMVRSLAGLYKQGRSTVNQGWLLKLKRFEDAEAVVIGIEEQLHNGNTAIKNALGQLERSSHKAGMVGKNSMGALKVRGLNGTFKGVEFNIGTGFTAAVRDSIWADKDLIGKVVKFKYFPLGCVDAPRFPVFLGFRSPGDM